MTWKWTALVSGATLLAGWLASAPPGPATPSTGSAPSQSPQTAAATSDIQQQAERLQTRPRQSAADEYGAPARNLFRFGPKETARSTAPEPAVRGAAPVEERAEPTPQPPLPPPLSLSGVASDPAGERTVRTAILSSPNGVLLVREGEEILGQYRVGAIAEDAVELTRLADGATFRITLKP
jgi:hypothetical protein